MKAGNLSSWKFAILASGLGLLLFLSDPNPVSGQCGSTLSTRNYDTLLTGIGYGNYTVSFPQWNADSGVLMSVRLGITVSLQYGFTLTNASAVPSTYTLLVGRYDQITGTAMNTYSNVNQQTIGVYPLNPGASVSRPGFSFLHNAASIDTITEVAPFIGGGSLSFAYSPITYSIVQASNNASYAFAAAGADTMHFTVSYQYCQSGVLASSLIRWTAVFADSAGAGVSGVGYSVDPSIDPTIDPYVDLAWTMANEQPGRSYEIEESDDGAHFNTVAEIPSLVGASTAGPSLSGSSPSSVSPGSASPAAAGGTADYRYTWKPAAALTAALGKWYFRLKIIDATGATGYSSIKEVEAFPSPSNKGLRLFPVPAKDFVDIIFGDGDGGAMSRGTTGAGASGDWQVELYAADGRLVERAGFTQTRVARLGFEQPLPAGVYFVRAKNTVSGIQYTAPLVVR